MNRYDIYDIDSGITVQGILPTPLLLSEGTVRSLEAYREEKLEGDMGLRYPGGLWRVRDDGYDSKYEDIEYRKVRVLVVEGSVYG